MIICLCQGSTAEIATATILQVGDVYFGDIFIPIKLKNFFAAPQDTLPALEKAKTQVYMCIYWERFKFTEICYIVVRINELISAAAQGLINPELIDVFCEKGVFEIQDRLLVLKSPQHSIV